MLRLLITAAVLWSTMCAHAGARAPAGRDPADWVEKLAATAKVQTAFQAIEAGAARDIQAMIALNEIPAPTFAEGPRAARFAQMLREAGLQDVMTDEVGNVIARRAGMGGGPTVAFIAHLDTVFPAGTDVTVRVEGDTYRAPGVGDNARGLAYLLALARALDAGGLRTRGDILFVGSVAEEGLGDLRGVRHLFRAGGPKIDIALAVDSAEQDRLVNVAVGSIRYRLTISGPGGHSYTAFGRANPHHALAAVIARFDAAAGAIAASPGAKATYNIGRMGGGTSINSIPTEAWAEVDMRSSDPDRLQALDAAFLASVEAGVAEENAGRASGEALAAAPERVGLRPAGSMAEDALLARVGVAAFRKVGIEPQFSASSTDANIPLSLGIPALTISRGGVGGNAHAPDEWWRAENPHLAVQAGLLIALAMAGAR